MSSSSVRSSKLKVIPGKLKFKGDDKVKQSSYTKKRERQDQVESEAKDVKPPEEYKIEVLLGTGRITSSGTTVHGHFTEFMKQLQVGDALIINHPTSLQEETKIIRMVLSNVSIGISSAFSTDLISTTPFKYIKAPKDKEDEEAKALQVKHKKHKEEVEAFGTYASAGGTKFTYRVRNDTAYGGYKIVTESTDRELSREELLNMRSTKKSDRHCY